MTKKILILSTLLFLNNCSSPGTAFLGPIFTGAKTGSVAQASLSFGSNRVISSINKELIGPNILQFKKDFNKPYSLKKIKY